MSDPAFSVDKLRDEERERAGLKASRDNRVIYELTAIKASLWVLAGLLLFIAWRLS